MNIPNYLTLLRIAISFICIGLVIKNSFLSLIVAFILFLIASLTDFLDGFIARKKGDISDLGKLLDPIADKILIIGIFLSFLVIRIVNVWMVVVIMTREFFITGVRLFALNRGYVLEAKRWGKHKTFSQMLGINVIFVILIMSKMFPSNPVIAFFLDRGIFILVLYIALITAFSGFHYLWVNRKIIKNF